MSLAGIMEWTSLGCFNDTTGPGEAHALKIPDTSGIEAKKLKMTIECCQVACKTSGLKFAGVEYGKE
jgi:hypothetical protein